MVTLCVHVQVPDGMSTTSPFAALFTAFSTSVFEQLAALMVEAQRFSVLKTVNKHITANNMAVLQPVRIEGPLRAFLLFITFLFNGVWWWQCRPCSIRCLIVNTS
jgi:hypothetical protein